VALCAPSSPHLVGKLIAVRIVVAIGALRGRELEIGARPFACVAARAWNGLVLPKKRELRSRVLLNGEERRPEPVLVVAARAIGFPERAAMGVAVAIGALFEPQLPVATRWRKSW
jgi:hypothetical protein